MQKNNKNKKVKIDNLYKEKKIEILELDKLESSEQLLVIENTLNEMYEDKVVITNGMVNKCIKLKVSKYDDYMILAHQLVVEKTNRELIFKFQNKASKFPLFILFSLALLVGLISATYSGLIYLEYAQLNKDIDGDGIPDINLDVDGDGNADINIDTNNDNIPDLNIDYKGNNQPVFNIDTDGDGVPDFNLVTDATVDVDSCIVNCDTTGDGWPNHNYDIDGDGIPDFDIYDPESGMITGSIDLDGDMVCDVMCDDDGDGECDRNCIVNNSDILGSGPSNTTGNNSNNVLSGSLIVEYSDSGSFALNDLFPDDQEGYDNDYPSNSFSVTNQSDYTISYKITMVVDTNTYVSNNFMYKLESTNNGYSSDFKTAPWADTIINSYVLIGPKETQDYTISFKLNGINEEQNYDQGQTFSGHLIIGD